MKKHDLHMIISAIFLVTAIEFQTLSFLYGSLSTIPISIFFSFLAWVFSIRAKKAMQKEYQELENIFGRLHYDDKEAK